MTRNLKIRPNFTDHPTIKTAENIKALVIYFGPSNHILSGIGEAFPNLEQLMIHDNSIKFYERQNFVNLKKLKVLDMQNKQIEFMAEDSFFDLENLEKLSFFQNEIESLPKRLLVNLKKLKQLICSFNKISKIDKDFFRNNLEVEEIDFRNNLLKQIDVDFTKFSKIIELSFKSNDCIDSFFSKKHFYAYSLTSVDEVQKVIEEHCKENSESKLMESWLRTIDFK